MSEFYVLIFYTCVLGVKIFFFFLDEKVLNGKVLIRPFRILTVSASEYSG